MACIPIHKLDAAMPREAKLPDFLCMAKLCIIIVEIKIIPATPSSPSIDPVVEPMASRTNVD